MIKFQTDTSQNENELLVSKIAEKKVPKILKPQGHFLKDFPVSDILDISMTEEKIKRYTYTKEEVDRMINHAVQVAVAEARSCLLYTSPSPRDKRQSRMPSSA